ncbi:PhnD/SsuA/transferrin family substrate-binding protein [Nitrincola iocasae]|jgi:phosphonate transport system substrate-binding protein|uniref:Phosphate/phosphite/phosphonate ABC transporter substrate-binding protein n=1 Tax=Nitrincola iocasae TaxID=2614693 RepID=A0A5J6LFI1_9GAMM|nr:PhnD/SsuA/transferrin family substrate-binding protein [Nitrincola iocasae]QEW06971.1 phosphate/phosphite/phosphonate ABC transporter substrate-binding protein [Nitrincola iocasae]
MPLNLTVSPDFAPDHISGWFYFNTYLQRKLGIPIHLELYDSFDKQRADIRAGKVDLIYANPYDASMLVRELGFKALMKPAHKADETVIAVSVSSAIDKVENIQPGSVIATTDDPDVHTMGMIMLESADLDADNITIKTLKNYVLVAKNLLKGEADAGFFLKQAYNELSELIRSEMKPLVSSQIDVIHHVLLAGPSFKEHESMLKTVLLDMQADEKGRGVLQNMGLVGWELMSEEDSEFMIDLIDTLID